MIKLKNLVKDYGSLRAVDHINFNINDEEILGFLGPNGAGKTTTLQMITCFLEPTMGDIIVNNMNIKEDSKKVRKKIGYLPEDNPLYEDMTVFDYLKFVADIRDIDENEFKSRLKEVIDKCGLEGVVSKPIHTLSKGYHQRVGLAQAIIHDPEILILDEPTTGLDPNQIVEIRALIKKLGKEKTLIMSTHILQEVQAVCDRIVIINRGKIVADGSKEELKARFKNKTELVLELIAEEKEIPEIQDKIDGITILSIDKKTDTFEVKIEFDSKADKRVEIYNYIKKKDWTLLGMHREHISLEDVFKNLTIENPGGQK